MTFPGEGRAPDGILVDEVGIESGVWGRFRLKSAYQQVFRQEGEHLIAFAVEGRTQPQLEGNSVPPALFNAAVVREERPALGRLGRALHVGNIENVVGSPALFLGLDADAFSDLHALGAEFEALSARLAQVGIEPRSATVILRGYSGVSNDVLAAVSGAIRALDMRVCLEENGPVFSSPALLWAISPDLLCIGADRLRLLTREQSALRMVRSMYGVLRERGIEIMAAGIESRDDFICASDTGAGYFQGNYLARPGLAGTLFDFNPLSIGTLRGVHDNVVPLFGLSA